MFERNYVLGPQLEANLDFALGGHGADGTLEIDLAGVVGRSHTQSFDQFILLENFTNLVSGNSSP